MTDSDAGRGRSGFATMDGVRGIAAICVMLGHFGFPGVLGMGLISSGYFAVDVFFGLSGFVIAYSYDAKLRSGLSPVQFIKIRLIRLYPLYALGLALGVCHLGVGYWRGEARNPELNVVMVILFGLLFLPWGGRFDDGRDGGQTLSAMFPLNMPSWSLFYELFVNALYAWFRPRGLMLIAVLSSSLVLLALDAPPYAQAVQFPRVIFCFYLGAEICRLWRGGRLQVPGRFALLAPALVFIVCSTPLNGWGYMLALTLGVPLILCLSVATPAAASLRRLFILLGEISYPLYVIHMPSFSLMRLIDNWLSGANVETQPSVAAKALLIIALLAVCPFLARKIDAPLRRTIAARVFETRARVAPRPQHST